MKKIILPIFALALIAACSNSTPESEKKEEQTRNTQDSLQKIKDSLEVERMMMEDEAKDTAPAAQ